jgi:hypothetical protein
VGGKRWDLLKFVDVLFVNPEFPRLFIRCFLFVDPPYMGFSISVKFRVPSCNQSCLAGKSSTNGGFKWENHQTTRGFSIVTVV